MDPDTVCFGAGVTNRLSTLLISGEWTFGIRMLKLRAHRE